MHASAMREQKLNGKLLFYMVKWKPAAKFHLVFGFDLFFCIFSVAMSMSRFSHFGLQLEFSFIGFSFTLQVKLILCFSFSLSLYLRLWLLCILKYICVYVDLFTLGSVGRSSQSSICASKIFFFRSFAAAINGWSFIRNGTHFDLSSAHHRTATNHTDRRRAYIFCFSFIQYTDEIWERYLPRGKTHAGVVFEVMEWNRWKKNP